MRNVFLSFLLFVSGCAPALAGDMVYNTQIQMMPPPVEDKHVATKEYVDGADVALGQRVDGVEATANNSVQYDADGNITFQAGMDMNTSIPQPDDPEGNPVPPVVRTVLDTDAAGNFIVGNPDSELNLRASMRPTVEIAGGDTAESVALMSDLSAYETSADHDTDMAYKADLVGGRVPESQMAPGAISKNYTVPTQADLVTLTQAVINDRALTGSGTTDDPHQRFLLWSEPPTDINNWVDITGGGGGGSGDSGVVSWAGKSGAVIPEIEDVTGLRAELDDKANASDLAGYAPIASPALTGTPTAPTPPTTATGTRIATADFVNTRIASSNAATATTLQTARTIQTNLESASAASFNGSANITPGVAGILPIANGGSGRSTSPVFATDAPLAGGGDSTADRTLHILPATAATATEPGDPGSVVYAADNDTTSRDKAVTPAGIMGLLSGGGGGFKIKVITASGSGTLDNSAGMALIFVVSGGQGGDGGRNQNVGVAVNGGAGNGGDTGIFIASLPASAPYSVNIGSGGAGSAWNGTPGLGGITKITLNGTAYSSLAGSYIARGSIAGDAGGVTNGGTTLGGYSLFSSYGRGGNGGSSSGAAGTAGTAGVAIILYQ